MKTTLCLISFFLTRTLFAQQAAQPVRLADCISHAFGEESGSSNQSGKSAVSRSAFV